MTRLSYAALAVAFFVIGCARIERQPATVFISRHTDPTKRFHPVEPVFGTYNLHWLLDAQGLQKDLNRLDFVSVWAFQEVRTTTGDRDNGLPQRLCKLLPPGEWHIAWVPLNPLKEINRRDEREGQVVASRFPIRYAEIWDLKTSGEKRRVALAVVLSIDGRDVRFVNTDHEPAIASISRGNMRQVQSLVEQLKNHDNMPTAIVGDFNTSGCVMRFISSGGDCSDLREEMKSAGFVEAIDPSHRTFRSTFYSATLDHVFLRGLSAMDTGVDERATGSDHLPVWCRVSIHGSNDAGSGSRSAGMANFTR